MKPFTHSTRSHTPATGTGILRTAAVLTIAMLAFSVFCQAQSQPSAASTIEIAPAPSQPSADSAIELAPSKPSLDSTIEVVKSDMRAQRNMIISVAMQFSDKDGAAFWPIYRKYEYERSTLNDSRAAVIKEYAEKYPTLTDAEAKEMTERMLECDSRDAALKRKYFKEFNKVLPPLTVAKFFQLDHRIDLIMDSKVESSLPPLTAPQQQDQER